MGIDKTKKQIKNKIKTRRFGEFFNIQTASVDSNRAIPWKSWLFEDW